VWKEVYLSAGLATPVALMGASGQGKTALFELLRINLASSPSGSASLHKGKQHQQHSEVGVPTLDVQECLMSLPHSRRITLIDVPGTSNTAMCMCVDHMRVDHWAFGQAVQARASRTSTRASWAAAAASWSSPLRAKRYAPNPTYNYARGS
jgi:ABC-type branched-subunit amino acid transport system ATPase component